MNIINNIIGKGKGMSKMSENIVDYIDYNNPLDESDTDMNRFRIRGRK